MLFELENTDKETINKLFDFAKQNQLKSSIIEDENDYFLPGKPLSSEELFQLIENSPKSGMVNLENAHREIRNSLNG
jgi:hypothetical protein